jgi:ubiquinone/menaquinone biosynthesis C-methylase UbiE
MSAADPNGPGGDSGGSAAAGSCHIAARDRHRPSDRACHADGVASDDVYLHGHHDSVLRSHRWRTAENSAAYLLPELRAGMSLLDVGCGPGTITADLARRVAPGEVVGLDRDAGVLAEAAAANLANLRFATGDVYALPFADRSFDVVHAHQVLQHLTTPSDALVEMGRVCREGGIVAVRDVDMSTMTWYPGDPRLDWWLTLYRELARATGAEPDAGRRLLAWAHAAGFRTVRASAATWCYATPGERAWWAGLWAERVTRSRFADQARDEGRATPAELEEVAAAFRDWAAEPDAWFAMIHGELLISP